MSSVARQSGNSHWQKGNFLHDSRDSESDDQFLQVQSVPHTVDIAVLQYSPFNQVFPHNCCNKENRVNFQPCSVNKILVLVFRL